jgi:hypothetical protein
MRLNSPPALSNPLPVVDHPCGESFRASGRLLPPPYLMLARAPGGVRGGSTILGGGCLACPSGVGGQVSVYLFKALFIVADHVHIRAPIVVIG